MDFSHHRYIQYGRLPSRDCGENKERGLLEPNQWNGEWQQSGTSGWEYIRPHPQTWLCENPKTQTKTKRRRCRKQGGNQVPAVPASQTTICVFISNHLERKLRLGYLTIFCAADSGAVFLCVLYLHIIRVKINTKVPCCCRILSSSCNLSNNLYLANQLWRLLISFIPFWCRYLYVWHRSRDFLWRPETPHSRNRGKALLQTEGLF